MPYDPRFDPHQARKNQRGVDRLYECGEGWSGVELSIQAPSGWYPYNHPRWGVTEVMRIASPATIRSLHCRGLLDGASHGSIPELWTNERGIDLLEAIHHDTGIFYDVTTDTLVYLEDHGSGYGSIAVH